jgi:dUTP pyrophosphatase
MLNAREIRHLIETKELISGYVDLDKQLQPSGFDLSLGEVHTYVGDGSVDFSNQERRIAETEPMEPDGNGWWFLPMGCYVIVYNEAVRMPLNLTAIARPRSTMLRNGATVETAVWDPGYHGRSSSLLVVHNPRGVRLKRNARIAQLVFIEVDEVDKGYEGSYQKERLGSAAERTER